MTSFGRKWASLVAGLGLAVAVLVSPAQQERHGRGYKAPPPTAPVTVVVEKSFNQKPFPNVSVVFRSMRDDKIIANLETKTDPDGRATLDLLEVGSHITVQVIATGFATYATDFDLSGDGKQLLVKLERPRAQISDYSENQDRPAAVQPGVQEHQKAAPPPASPTAPLQTTPIANTPTSSTTNPATSQPQP